MNFSISTRNGTATHEGDARYLIEDNGVLTVYADDGARYRYSPAYWQAVEDRPDTSIPTIDEVHTG